MDTKVVGKRAEKSSSLITELNQIKLFCEDARISPDQLLETINHKKVSPMIRGISDEVRVRSLYHSDIFDIIKDDNCDIAGDVILLVKDDYKKQFGEKWSVEFKPTIKIRHFLDKTVIRIKCHRSRSMAAKDRIKVRANRYNLPIKEVHAHHDSYHHSEFDMIFANLYGAFQNKELSERDLEFLNDIGCNEVKDLRYFTVSATSNDVISSKSHKTCTVKICENDCCPFIPKQPLVTFMRGEKYPTAPWSFVEKR